VARGGPVTGVRECFEEGACLERAALERML